MITFNIPAQNYVDTIYSNLSFKLKITAAVKATHNVIYQRNGALYADTLTSGVFSDPVLVFRLPASSRQFFDMIQLEQDHVSGPGLNHLQ